MTWTHQPPSKPGFYWLREFVGKEWDGDNYAVPIIVQVCGDMDVQFLGLEKPCPIIWCAHDLWWPVPVQEPPV